MQATNATPAPDYSAVLIECDYCEGQVTLAECEPSGYRGSYEAGTAETLWMCAACIADREEPAPERHAPECRRPGACDCL